MNRGMSLALRCPSMEASLPVELRSRHQTKALPQPSSRYLKAAHTRLNDPFLLSYRVRLATALPAWRQSRSHESAMVT